MTTALNTIVFKGEAMNFQEYLKQNPVVRNYYVEVTEKDCKHIHDARPFARKLITLEVNNKLYQYILTHKDNLLRTMDEKQHPKDISCFLWRGKA